MSNRFLSTAGSGNSNLTNGSADLFINSLGISNLDQSLPLKTNGSREIISVKLDQTDINNLQTDLNLKSELSYTKSDTHSNPPAGQVKTYFKTDGDFYKKDENGTETKIAGGGTGDVQGPAVSVDNTIPRFDATTGKIIQGSGVTIDDSNNITTPGYISATSGGITGTLSTNTVQPITTNNFDIGAAALRYNNIYGNNFVNALGNNIDVSSEVSSNNINQVVAFSGTDMSGKKIRNTGVTIDAANNVLGMNTLDVITKIVTADLDIYGLTNAKNINNVGTITTQGVRCNADNTVDIGDNTKQIKDIYIKGDIKYNKPTGNVFLGPDAGGISLGLGINNVGIGKSALPSITSGNNNIALAFNSGVNITTGLSNICLGGSSGSSIQSGISNICIGPGSGQVVSTGSNNIFIGSTTTGSATLSNAMALGYNVTNDVNNSAVIGNTDYVNIRPSADRTCDIGTTTRNFKDIYSDKLILNTQVQSNKYYNNNGLAGIEIANTAPAAVSLNGVLYQGKNNQIVTLNGSGTIQQPSSNATIDGNGNATFKNLDLLNITGGGTFRGNKLQSNDATKTLELFNRATVNGVGILVDNTTGGNVQLTGLTYNGGAVNRIMKVDGLGNIQLSNATLDVSGNLIASNTTLDSLTLKNNLNFDIDNSHDVGTVATSARSIYYKTNLSGNTAIFSGTVTTANLFPQPSAAHDIGSNALKYKDLYLAGTVNAVNNICTTNVNTNTTTTNLVIQPTGSTNFQASPLNNTGTIKPNIDNTQDIGSTTLTYKNIYIKGDVFKNGVPLSVPTPNIFYTKITSFAVPQTMFSNGEITIKYNGGAPVGGPINNGFTIRIPATTTLWSNSKFTAPNGTVSYVSYRAAISVTENVDVYPNTLAEGGDAGWLWDRADASYEGCLQESVITNQSSWQYYIKCTPWVGGTGSTAFITITKEF